MKSLSKTIVLFVCLLWLPALPAVAQQGWNIMTEELPPYNFMRSDQVHGICTDILLQLLAHNNISVDRGDIRLLPWARAYSTLQSRPQSILFSTARTPQREKLFKWVGPVISFDIGLIALKTNNIVLQSPGDMKQYTIGTIRDGVAEHLVLQAGAEKGNLEGIASPVSNIKKLQAGRIDLFAFSVPSARHLMLKLGMDPDNYQSVHTLKHTDLYYAFHKDTDEQLIRALNTTLQQMKQVDAEGTSAVDRIEASYLRKSVAL